MKQTFVCVSFSNSLDKSYSYRKFVTIKGSQEWLKKQLQSPIVDFISIRKVRNPNETSGKDNSVLRPYF